MVVVEWSGNPVGEVSARPIAARHVRAVRAGEAVYLAERGGRAQPGCVLGGGRGHVEVVQVTLAGAIQYNTIQYKRTGELTSRATSYETADRGVRMEEIIIAGTAGNVSDHSEVQKKKEARSAANTKR